jgi:hypothetical protein
MRSFARILLVLAALLSSGALQVAAAASDDACCAEETAPTERSHSSCGYCPPGLACACCPMRGAVQAGGPELVPGASPGVALAVAAAEPSLVASVTDIFHPPRA